MAWRVLIHPEAEIELSKIPARERAAIDSAMDKLRAIGPALGFPHTSDVRVALDLRELRPRQGRSPWRAFYRQIGSTVVVAAIGPEAAADQKGFTRAVRSAEHRLEDLEDAR
jgi:hypothetical protein